MKKYFCFSDQNSQNTFINAFSIFKANNIKDKHQVITHSLAGIIPDSQTEIALALEGTGECLKPGFVFFLLIGLGYPYLFIV